MFEDIFPEVKKRRIKKLKRVKKKNIDLFPKGQTVKPPSKKAKDTMKRAMVIRRYIKKGEKDKE